MTGMWELAVAFEAETASQAEQVFDWVFKRMDEDAPNGVRLAVMGLRPDPDQEENDDCV
jgi:hypothetical protein